MNGRDFGIVPIGPELILVLICVIFIPLGIWKAVELIVMLFHHIHWN